jgi:hypothetical protein
MSPGQSSGPLNNTHLDAMNKVLASIPPALDLAQACQDCGWDVSEHIAQLEAQRQMATNVKAKFFPMAP